MLGARASLIVRDTDGNETEREIARSPFSLGRQGDNDLVLLDNRISRQHARIVSDGEEYVIEDLRSRHGTFVNGERVQLRVLKGGDEISLGGSDAYFLVFVFPTYNLIDTTPSWDGELTPPSGLPRPLQGDKASYVLQSSTPFAFGRSSVLFDGSSAEPRRVAIKVFRSSPPGRRNEFLNEIRAHGSLCHPSILPIIDFGERSWRDYGPFLVLPKCSCGNLRQVIRSKDFMPLAKATEILEPIAAAVDHAHANGVIHGDIKPENILFGGTQDDPLVPCLSDFGVAKYFPIEERISSWGFSDTQAGSQAGSSAYMSPEQIEHGIQSPRSDIYSLGVLAFELLAGTLPFDVSVTPYRQMKAKIAGELLDPQSINHLISDTTRNALNWVLSTDPADRPDSAARFVRALSIEDSGRRSDRPGTLPVSRIFVGYSHKDAKWLQRLETVLKPLTKEKGINLWSDQMIDTGSQWRAEIDRALRSAEVAVLLVSQHFLASNFIAENELPPLLQAADSRGVRIVWVAVSACLYQSSEVARYQAANDPSKPLDALHPSALNRELVRIAEKIRDAVQQRST